MKMRFACLISLALLVHCGLADSYTITIPAGACRLIANQLDKPGGNTLSNLMPSLPCDARFMKYHNLSNAWITTTYSTGCGWANGAITLDPGEGAFLCSCCASNFYITFTGTQRVPVLPINIPAGKCYLLSRQIPSPGTPDTISGMTFSGGETAYTWNGMYTAYAYDEFDLTWYPSVPTTAVGEAMWIGALGATLPTTPDVPCPTYCCLPPPANMVAWWPFDETNGIVANDRAGLVNNQGTWFGSPTPIVGMVSNALCFNGTVDFVQVTNHPEINFTGSCTNTAESFTIDAWIRANTNGAYTQILLDKRVNPGSTPQGYHLYLFNGRLGCQIGDGSSYFNHNSATPDLRDGHWHFIAVTVARCTDNANLATLYVDGAPVLNEPDYVLGNLNNSADLLIARHASGGGYYSGCLDELEFFKRVLTPQEIQAIYNAGSAGKCKTNCTDALTLICATNKTVYCPANWTFDPPTVIDPCCPNNNYTLTYSTVTNSPICPWSFTRTWTVVDCLSRTAVCSQVVTVLDTNPPIIICATNKTVECNSPWSFDPATAWDECCGTNVTVWLASSNLVFADPPCRMVWEGVWQAKDCCTNYATCTQTVTVVDTQPPVLNGPSVVSTFDSGWDGWIATASGEVTWQGAGGNPDGYLRFVDLYAGPTYIIAPPKFLGNWLGHSAFVWEHKMFTSTPTFQPVVTITGRSGGSVSWWPAAVSGPTGWQHLVMPLQQSAMDWDHMSVKDWATVSLILSDVTEVRILMDANPNLSNDTEGVDNVMLAGACSPNKAVECGTPWAFDRPSAWDECCGNNVTYTLISSNSTVIDLCHTLWSGVWQITDCCTNSTYCTQQVVVVDTQAPIITCATNKTVECNSPWSFDPATAWDLCCGTNVTVWLVSSNLVFADPPCRMVWEGVWKAMDYCTNYATCTQTVTVVDTQPPLLTCPVNKTVEAGSAWSFDWPSAYDECCGTNLTLIALQPLTNGNCCTQVISQVWLATDCCTNSITCTQTVTVVDLSAPTITSCPANLTIVAYGAECLTNIPDLRGQVVATDNCLPLTITQAPIGGLVGAGTYALAFTVCDACGNCSYCTNWLTVQCTNPCVPPPTNMTAWWPFDETNGFIANDCADFNNQGNYSGDPTHIVGMVSNALCFNGSTDFVLVTNHPEINFTGSCTNTAESFTIDAWIRANPNVSHTQTLLDKRVNLASTPRGYHLYLYNGRLGFQIADGAGYFNHNSATPELRDGQWHFITVTVGRCANNANVVTLYVDGAPVYSSPDYRLGDLDNSADLLIGRHAGDGGYYSGCLDELELIKRVLNPQEIQDIYNAGSAGKCKTNCLDRIPPFIISVDCVSTGICVHFSEPLDPGSIDPANFKVNQWLGLLFNDCTPFTAVLQPDGKTVCLSDFDPPLATVADWAYLYASGVKDLCGNLMVPVYFPFCCPGYTQVTNDYCTNCTAITLGGTNGCVYSTWGSTICATPDGQSSCPNSWPSPDVWYCLTSLCPGTVVVDTCVSMVGNSFDTVLSVHTNCPGTAVNELVCNDDDLGGCAPQSRLTFNVQAGQTYYIRVAGKNGAKGLYQLHVNIQFPAPILICAGDKTVPAGQPWTFDPPNVPNPCCSNNLTLIAFSPQTNGNCCTQTISQVWQATCCSNSATCTQTVTVVCTTAPIITCLPSKTIVCATNCCCTNWDFDLPQVSSVCCPIGSLSLVVIGTSVMSLAPCTNVYTRTWQVSDGCGHAATCSQSVTVAAQAPARVKINIAVDAAGVHITFPTQPCYKYTVLCSEAMSDHPTWAVLGTLPGDGLTHELLDPGPLHAARFYRLKVDCPDCPPGCTSGMVPIPAGSFIMGNCLDPGEGYSQELPLHLVYVSPFCMDANQVSYAFWQQVCQWAASRGYGFDRVGLGKAADHPVHSVSWYDAVKWCNARSEREGWAPCYYTDAALTAPYKSGQNAPYVKRDANGYRLPTEAEWEKAARGGLAGRRFPWGDLITHGNANYYSQSTFAYDTSSTRGFHPDFDYGDYPYTSPVGHFAPNGYGLYDMAGNMFSWCWDWYDPVYYGASPATDPRGPSSGTGRVCRGGYWSGEARTERCAMRASAPPVNAGNDIGFRCVRAD